MMYEQRGVVILGCGLSGMLTALRFAQMNISTTIIEHRKIDDKDFTHDIRTTALTPSSARFLDEIKMWADIETSLGIMSHVHVMDNKSPEMIHFEDKESVILGYIAENTILKKKLLEKVLNNELIKIIDDVEYSRVKSYEDHSIIYFDNRENIKAELIIVCDGHHSKVREYYFSNKINKSYNQIALTFKVFHEFKHKNTAIEHFMPSGPLAILPLQDENYSSIIWTLKAPDAKLLQNLAVCEIESILEDICASTLGYIKIDSPIAAFPLKAKLAYKYFYNKIVLVADSAHIIHPLSGQGLNQGIKDIDNLVDLISNNIISNNILLEYQKSRKSDNFHMYLITDYLNLIFSNDVRILWYLRRLGIKALNKISIIKYFMLQYAMGKRLDISCISTSLER